MTVNLVAQSYSPCYTNNMAQGDEAFKQGKYSTAKNYYATAKQCAGGNPSEAQKKINSCDAKLKAQQEAAEAKRKEEEAKRKAQQEAAEAKRKEEEAKNSQIITVNGVSFKMKRVQGGSFTMGCTSEQGGDCDGDEKPSHQVTLSDYWIGETEVTQALWEAVMGSNPSSFKGDNRPVEKVSWDDCQEFIRKLNALTGKTFALPTEAQWEYAARGGNKSRHCKYAGSNTIGDVAWYRENCYDKGSSSPDYGTHPVKGKQANELGLYDMSGNVWEWCEDWYGSYSSSSQTNPTGPSSGSLRVYRGGSWYSYAGNCRVSYRYDFTPVNRFYYLGFRLSLVR